MEKSVELNLLRNRLAEFEIPHYLALQEAKEMTLLLDEGVAEKKEVYRQGAEAALAKASEFELIIGLVREQISDLEASD